MPETTPPLYDAFVAAQAEVADVQARFAAELAAVNARLAAAEAALAADLHDGVEYVATLTPPPIIKRVGDRIELVTKPFLGHPNPATA